MRDQREESYRPTARPERDWLGRKYVNVIDLNGKPPAAVQAVRDGPDRRSRSPRPILGALVALALGLVLGLAFWPSPQRQPEDAGWSSEPFAEAGPRTTAPDLTARAEAALQDLVPAGSVEARRDGIVAPRRAAAERPTSAPLADTAETSPPQPDSRGAASPSFNCRYARTRAEQVICANEDLAAADRALDRAYRDAIASGIPAAELRRAQDLWLGVREAAAPDPAALADAYEVRIAQLEAMGRN